MTETTKRTVDLLKSYPAMKSRAVQLRFELDNPPVIGDDEFIGCLAAGARADGRSCAAGGRISDKTMAIATQYGDIKAGIEKDSKNDIKRELRLLEAEINRLEFYVSLLDKNESDIIRMIYFERKAWKNIEADLHISERTLFRYRKSAIAELSSMYLLLEEVRNKKTKNLAAGAGA